MAPNPLCFWHKDFDIGKISAAIDKHENFDRLTSKKEKDRLQKESTPARKTFIIASTCRLTWFCSRWRSKKILRRLDIGVLWYFEGHQACGWVPVSEEFLHKTHETLTKHHKPKICALSAPIQNNFKVGLLDSKLTLQSFQQGSGSRDGHGWPPVTNFPKLILALGPESRIMSLKMAKVILVQRSIWLRTNQIDCEQVAAKKWCKTTQGRCFRIVESEVCTLASYLTHTLLFANLSHQSGILYYMYI